MKINFNDLNLRNWNDAYKDYQKAKTLEEENKYLKELSNIALFKGKNDSQENNNISNNNASTNISDISIFYVYMRDFGYARLHPEMFISKLFQNDDEAKDIKAFLKENALNNDCTANYDYEIKELFASDISVNEFKQKYLKRINELKQENLKDNIEETSEELKKDEFKPIEVKSDNIRESMEDILSKLDIQNIKDERDLLAIFLAYKNGENLYDKRV
ncbi:hypothetical protein [Campylobacter sp. RM12651]|uniref:hypothetical protein n=1 Tax=Campylobacter sp. RM12651 TaxID=1660079 RepID=UPI001EFA7725|nr:hypothetical protein [Campylobacter sp. RM12651]ULO03470.1 hypothetical protein AVBRAN_1011 [Campylobacter sp. RM12651]